MRCLNGVRDAFAVWIPRFLWAIALLFALAWIVSGLLPRESSGEALRYFDEEYLAKTRSRAALSYAVSGLATLATFAALYLLSRSNPISARFAGEATGQGAVKLGFLLGITASALFSLVNFPFSAYGGYLLEKRFGLSRMTFGTWLGDYVKGSLMNLVAYGVGAAFVAWAIVSLPRSWHYVVTIAFLGSSLLLSAAYPLIIAPAFNKFHPLEDVTLMEDIRDLSNMAGMKVDRVLVMEASAKTARVNAYFAGVGRTRQVVLYDTLLTSHSPEELRLVVAHELGHWKYGHIVVGNLVSALGVLISLSLFRLSAPVAGTASMGFRSLESVLISLLVFTVLFSYVVTPISNSVSRSFERAADAYSLDLTGDRDSFILSQVILSKGNLSDVEPPAFVRWFAWTHPTALERIRSAK